MAGNKQPVYDASDASFVNAAAIVSLTDNSGGTAADTVAAIGATYSQTEVRNAVASLSAKVNAILSALRDGNVISG